MKNILETLSNDGSFRTLLSMLSQVDLADKLNGSGPFTLFAPTDQAFGRINLDEISKDVDNLTTLLSYHILSGEMTAAKINEAETLYTECGKSLTVHKEEGKSVIDNGNLVTTDIPCSNGIIHVIDNVFLPQFSGWYCGCC